MILKRGAGPVRVANMPHSAKSASHATQTSAQRCYPLGPLRKWRERPSSTGILAADCSLSVTSSLMMQSKLKYESRPPDLKIKRGLIVALAVGLALGACASSSPTSSSPPPSSSRDMLGLDSVPVPSSSARRELTPAEKKIIANAIAPSLRDAATAQYRWPKIQDAPDGQVNYCGTVNAKSPYPAYNGRQAYIISATVSGGKISSAVVDLDHRRQGLRDRSQHVQEIRSRPRGELIRHTPVRPERRATGSSSRLRGDKRKFKFHELDCGVHSSTLAPASDWTRASSAASSRAGPE